MISVIVPFYRNNAMLRVHLHKWLYEYSSAVHEKMKLIIVDDGSPEPAIEAIGPFRRGLAHIGARLLRIGVDIPWNRGGARNLGSTVAESKWLLHVDIDHVIPPETAEVLARTAAAINDRKWYRFRRFRVGKADDTRKKDTIPERCEFGEIHEHVDSYLVTKQLYWENGGYDEDYSGCLGGGTPFVKALARRAVVEKLQCPLHVYTRSACPDASDLHLSRERGEFKKRRIEKGKINEHNPKNPLRFPWAEISL